MKQIILTEITAYALRSPQGWGPQEIKEYFKDENLAKEMVRMNTARKDYEILPVTVYVDHWEKIYGLTEKGIFKDELVTDQLKKIEAIRTKLSEPELDFLNNYPWKI